MKMIAVCQKKVSGLCVQVKIALRYVRWTRAATTTKLNFLFTFEYFRFLSPLEPLSLLTVPFKSNLRVTL